MKQHSREFAVWLGLFVICAGISSLVQLCGCYGPNDGPPCTAAPTACGDYPGSPDPARPIDAGRE
jgi:hypothetical protein